MKRKVLQYLMLFGPVAQLGERSVRIREVKGSNPSISMLLETLKGFIFKGFSGFFILKNATIL